MKNNKPIDLLKEEKKLIKEFKKKKIPKTISKILTTGIIYPSLVSLDYADIKVLINNCKKFYIIKTNFKDLKKDLNKFKHKEKVKSWLFYILGDNSLNLNEVHKIGTDIEKYFNEETNLIWGARIINSKKKIRNIILVLGE